MRKRNAGWSASAAYQQFLRLDSQEAIAESVEPLREHAALVEESKQNRYAAELWKSLAQARTMEELSMLDVVTNLLIYASDSEILGIYNMVEEVAQRRGLMG